MAYQQVSFRYMDCEPEAGTAGGGLSRGNCPTRQLSARAGFLNLGVARSPSDFRGVARLSTNFLKNVGIFKY